MIEIFDPESLPVMPVTWKIGGHGWHYHLDYSWFLRQVEGFIGSGDRVLDVGSLYSGMPKYLKDAGYDVTTLDKNPGGKPDINGDFMLVDLVADPFDVITWFSSIEHQDTLEDIQACYERSISVLPPGGVFIATFGVGPDTKYYSPIKGWILSVRDAMRIFGQGTVKGDYVKIWRSYRDNKYKLRDNYVARFKRWDEGTPDYVAAGVVVVKDRRVW